MKHVFAALALSAISSMAYAEPMSLEADRYQPSRTQTERTSLPAYVAPMAQTPSPQPVRYANVEQEPNLGGGFIEFLFNGGRPPRPPVEMQRTTYSAPGYGTPSYEPAVPERKIKARLFYVSEDGHGLTGVDRDVAYGADPSAQARAIIEAQLAPPDAPQVTAVPTGTTLRAVFVANGDAYVDVSGDIITGHPGGSLNEQLTVYTLVAALKTNLPAVNGVQILVDGKEVDTLAGHVDLRQPLVKNPTWVQ